MSTQAGFDKREAGYMSGENNLYIAVCKACEKEELTDDEIKVITSFIQRNLSESGNSGNIGLGESADINPDLRQRVG